MNGVWFLLTFFGFKGAYFSNESDKISVSLLLLIVSLIYVSLNKVLIKLMTNLIIIKTFVASERYFFGASSTKIDQRVAAINL